MGGLISQGLGTSMLQMGNIVKNPRIWIAPTLASAITGPLATCVFHMEMNGAAGLLRHGHLRSGGPDRRLHRLDQRHCRRHQGRHHPDGLGSLWSSICFVLPAVLSVIFCEIERKLGWIKENDLKLN